LDGQGDARREMEPINAAASATCVTVRLEGDETGPKQSGQGPKGGRVGAADAGGDGPHAD
jgi:hypothetical protein